MNSKVYKIAFLALIISAVNALAVFTAQAQVNIYGNSEENFFNRLITDGQDYYVLGGEGGKANISRIKGNGMWVWTRGLDMPSALVGGIVLPGGNLLFVGFTTPLDITNKSLIGEISPNGTFGPIKALDVPGFEYLSRIDINQDGTYSVVGVQTTPSALQDVIVLNVSPGLVINSKRIFKFDISTVDNFANDIEVLCNGDILVAGDQDGRAIMYQFNNSTFGLNATQNPLHFSYQDIAETSNCDILVVANSLGTDPPRITRFDAFLFPKWEASILGLRNLHRVLEDGNGNIIVLGSATIGNLIRPVVVKINDSSGLPSLSWGGGKYFENSQDNSYNGDIAITNSDGITFVDGISGSPNGFGKSDALMAITDDNLASDCTYDIPLDLILETTLLDGPEFEIWNYDTLEGVEIFGEVLDWGQEESCDVNLTCCISYDISKQHFLNNVSIITDNNDCKVTVNIGNIPDCDYISWIDWGDTNVDIGNFYSGNMPMHFYSASGPYVITYNAIEINQVTGLPCFEEGIQQEFTLNCRTCPACENNLAQNPGFFDGAIPGAFGQGGSTNYWVAAAGSPDLSANIQDCNPMGIQMWGCLNDGEAICQSGYNFIPGHYYSISFSARFRPDPLLTTPYVQFECYASNGCVNPLPVCIGCEKIGITSTISNTGWATYYIPNWTPISGQYSNIIIRAVNANLFPLISFGQIDNICIQENNCTPPPQDMVAWWPMDEQSGNISIDIISGLNGVQKPTGSFVPSVPGKVRAAFNFTSPSPFLQHLEVNNHADLNFGSGDFSIDAWILPSDPETGMQPIVDKLRNLNTGYALSVQPGNPFYISLVLGTTNGVELLQGPEVLEGEWNFVAVSVSQSSQATATFYVGNSTGFFQSTVAITNPYNASNSQDLLIGYNPFVPKWDITIDELEIFDRALDYSDFYPIWVADSDGKCLPVPVAVKDIEINQKFKVYPNPNEGEFTVELNEPAFEGMSLRIVALTGQVLLERQCQIGYSLQTIKANQLLSGMYFIQIISKSRVLSVHKFVKE